MFCEKCGSQIPEGTNVCPNCAAVNNPTPAPAPAPAKDTSAEDAQFALLLEQFNKIIAGTEE